MSKVLFKHYDGGLFHGLAHRDPLVIGIDPSATGTAIVAYSYNTGAWFGWLIRPESRAVRRLMDIHTAVSGVLHTLRLWGHVEHICMEGYSFGSPQGRELLGEVGGTIKRAIVSGFGIMNMVAYPTIVAPPTLKKFATGRGDADKSVVLLNVYRKWLVEIDNDNVGDAYALSRMAAAIVTETGLAYELDVVRGLERHTEWEQLRSPQSLNLMPSSIPISTPTMARTENLSFESKRRVIRRVLLRPLPVPSTSESE